MRALVILAVLLLVAACSTPERTRRTNNLQCRSEGKVTTLWGKVEAEDGRSSSAIPGPLSSTDIIVLDYDICLEGQYRLIRTARIGVSPRCQAGCPAHPVPRGQVIGITGVITEGAQIDRRRRERLYLVDAYVVAGPAIQWTPK